MAIYNANRIADLDKRSSYVLTPANTGLYEFMRRVLNLRNRKTPNAFGVLYDFALTDIRAAFEAHAAKDVPHGGAADTTNGVLEVSVEADILNKVMGEYAKSSPGLTAWNFRQVERNLPWADHINLLAWLYSFTEYIQAVAQAIDDHIADPGYHLAATTALDLSALPLVLPTPDGKVPSIGYNDGFSKYLVEIERTEPAFVKARMGTWIKDVALLAQEVIDKYNEHVTDVTAHTGAATDVTLKPIAQV